MFLGKKGILPTLILVFTLISFGAALFYSNEAIENQKGEIGVVVQDLLDLENEHKNDVIYDKKDLDQSINDFTNDFIKTDLNSDWSDTGAYPSLDEIKEKFAIYLNENLKGEYEVGFKFDSGATIIDFEGIKEYSLLKDNYEINIVGKDEFEFELGYDLSLLSVFVENLKYVVESCGEDVSCWEEEATFPWKLDNGLFEVGFPSVIRTYENNVVGKDEFELGYDLGLLSGFVENLADVVESCEEDISCLEEEVNSNFGEDNLRFNFELDSGTFPDFGTADPDALSVIIPLLD